MFNHIRHELPELTQINEASGRYYGTLTGKRYPSVTSVVGIRSKSDILEWRKRVGEEEATRASRRAANRGTKIHSYCEDYLNNKPVNPDLVDSMVWNSMIPELNRIDDIHFIEQRLWSDKLQVAGTVDCIAKYDGRLAVIDFKTSGRVKTLDDIHGYFHQTAAYSFMAWERVGILAEDLVIIMGCDESNTALVFKQKVKKWLPEFITIREEYAKLYNR